MRAGLRPLGHSFHRLVAGLRVLLLVCCAALAFSFGAIGQSGFRLPNGPALEENIKKETYAGPFESARENLLKTTEFLQTVLVQIQPRYKTVFNAFGGVDPSPLLLFNADTVISVGLETFGSPEEISKQLESVSELHTVAAYVAAHGYIRSEIGGFWSDGRKVGADFLVILKHVYGGKAIELRYLDKNSRHVEVTVEIGGARKRFLYFQTSMGATLPEYQLEAQGLTGEVAPELIAALSGQPLDAVLVKAAGSGKMSSDIFELIMKQSANGAVWMGEGAEALPTQAFVEQQTIAKLKGAWGYQITQAEIQMLKFRAPTAEEFGAAQARRSKGLRKWLSRKGDPVLNPSPNTILLEQPATMVCEAFMRMHNAAMNEIRKNQKPAGPRITW